jgi:spore coat protein U-like protein
MAGCSAVWSKFVRAFGTALAVGGLLCSAAHGASDGTLGQTSSGNLSISVTIVELVRISGLRDVAFGVYSGAGDLDNNTNICVYRNSLAAQYRITATTVEGAFRLTSGANLLPYRLYFNDTIGTTGEVLLAYNTLSATQTGANTQTVDCSVGGLKANVHVQILQADLQAARPGAYTGTLILTANPV